MKKKIAARILMVISVVALVWAIGFYIWYIDSNKKIEDSKDKYTLPPTTEAQMVTYDPNQAMTDDFTVPPVVKGYDIAKIQEEINPDIYACIVIPGSNSAYEYVIQSGQEKAEDFYLSRNVFGEYRFAGTIYSQKINKKDFSDPVTVLYGHNMMNGDMFGFLHKYESQKFFDKNREFYIYTDGHKLTYEIISAFDYDDRNIMHYFNMNDETSIQEYFNHCLNPTASNAVVRQGITLKASSGSQQLVGVKDGDRIVTLSTCSNISNSNRFLVQGVLRSDEITE